MDLFIGYIVFAGQGQLDADIKNYWSKCQIYRKQVYSRELYKNELTALHIITA